METKGYGAATTAHAAAASPALLPPPPIPSPPRPLSRTDSGYGRDPEDRIAAARSAADGMRRDAKSRGSTCRGQTSDPAGGAAGWPGTGG